MVRPLICVVKPKYGVCFISNAQDLQKEILTFVVRRYGWGAAVG